MAAVAMLWADFSGSLPMGPAPGISGNLSEGMIGERYACICRLGRVAGQMISFYEI